MTSNDTRKQDLADAKAWLCARWHQKHPNEQHIIQLADYAAHLRATPKPPAGGDAGELAAFGASDPACTLYPGENQAAERAAFVAGAALALPAPVVEGWRDIETASRDCITEIDMWCASAEANGEGWNLRGILMVGTPDWIKREDGSDYFPHENGGFLTHWRPVPAPPAVLRAALSEGRTDA